MARPPIILQPGAVPLHQWREIWSGRGFTPADDAAAAIQASRDTVLQALTTDAPIYGINTGFGRLANVSIPRQNLAELQHNLIMSHAAGIGEPLPPTIVRLAIGLKVASLARGYSGVRPEIIDTLVKLAEADIFPVIPSKGSVGASGDLAPLAHLSAPLIGLGTAMQGETELTGPEILAAIGMQPLELEPKEGLALLNGTQISTALALSGLFTAENVFCSAVVAGAMSLDAARGSDVPFDARIHDIRGHAGQIQTAKLFRDLLAGSEIRASHIDCGRVQDPYSLRCQPQVLGAVLDHLRYAARTLAIEANAVSDNPLVFAADGEILSGGNFHAEPVAISADLMAIAIAEIGSLSERRLSMLMDSSLSQLPPFLAKNGGINSGMMAAQISAAALASENKTLAHPASVDNIPTTANQEDHVSMATFAARRLADIAENVAAVVGIEMMAAGQGIEFLEPMQTSEKLQVALAKLRQSVPASDNDRFMHPFMQAIAREITDGAFNYLLPDDLLPSSAVET